MDSPDWIKNKKATITLISKYYDLFFQWPPTVTLSNKEIGKDLQNVPNIESFTGKCNWKGIKCLSGLNDWKIFEKNHQKLFLMLKTIY